MLTQPQLRRQIGAALIRPPTLEFMDPVNRMAFGSRSYDHAESALYHRLGTYLSPTTSPTVLSDECFLNIL